MKLDRQDQHLIDTDKLNGVTDYKWIILYFISLNFYCLLKKKKKNKFVGFENTVNLNWQ
jgi:hypothetical protein